MTRPLLGALLRVVTLTLAVGIFAPTPAHAAPPVGAFSPSLFKFATTIPDDGKDAAGGWQEAVADLQFVDARHILPRIWSCRVKVGMPLRAEMLGRISAESAAGIAAKIASDASFAVMHRQREWLVADFCNQLEKEMRSTFARAWRPLGARINGR